MNLLIFDCYEGNSVKNLVIDIGNTVVKTAVFNGRELISLTTSDNLSVEKLNLVHDSFPEISFSVISTVRDDDETVLDFLNKHYQNIYFSNCTPVPITNKYESPETLGKDRLAAVIGAISLFPSENILVIDAGTCITFDFIDADKAYHGGAISPGISMRFKALHNFTSKLPLVTLMNFKNLIGKNTENAILAGVVNGVLAEVETIIDRYKKEYAVTKVVICGGNTDFFADRLKNSIFANPNLVLNGLNEILIYNESSEKN
jgi:type III pantothenate kinase